MTQQADPDAPNASPETPDESQSIAEAGTETATATATATATPEPVEAPEAPEDSETPADSALAPQAASTPPASKALPWVTPEWLTSRHTQAFPEPDSLDLLKRKPIGRSRTRALVPAAILAALAASYLGATLLFPLTNLAPVVTKTPITVTAAAPALPSWPIDGTAGVGVQSMGSVSSTITEQSMASITKVITAMVILEAMPLNIGEQGPEYYFTQADSNMYWQYLRNNESALDVPVDGTLTQYQILQGILMGSAGNYTDFLVEQIWASDEEYSAAATDWLARNAVSGITVVEPTGINANNTALPGSLARLAEVALANPVFAEIVATDVATIPGNAEPVTNTNALLADAGVVGVKTGSLEGFNLLTAKDVTIDGTSVRLFAAVIDQVDPDTRDAESRRLLNDLEVALAPVNAVAKGTPVGNVSTVWGAQAELRTKEDANMVLWNSATATTATTLDLGDDWHKGAQAGSVTVTGPINEKTGDVVLASDLATPSAWWRLTHPLELWGLR